MAIDLEADVLVREAEPMEQLRVPSGRKTLRTVSAGGAPPMASRNGASFATEAATEWEGWSTLAGT